MSKQTTKDNNSPMENYVNDIICRNRVYRCLECSFVGREEASDNHQCETDHCMEQITK